MGFPHPDVRIRNNTPYGLLITTSHTATSVTVTFWSTPYATAAQTASNESASGVCRVVVTTRTRTYPDGKTEQDQFKSTYRPEGKFCDGSAVPPPPPG
jgi:vancomycin resistance protein YoaR